jgi:hypothetical protein
VGLYIHSPNTPPWRGAQLKHRDKFTFYPPPKITGEVIVLNGLKSNPLNFFFNWLLQSLSELGLP